MSKNLSGDLLYEILGNYDANKLSNDNHEYLNSNEYLIGKYLEKALKDKDSNFKYYFTCGIAGELAPDDPVIIVHEIIYDKDGREVSRDKSDQIYGHTSIKEWMKTSETDPINRKPIQKLESVQSERSEKLSQCFKEYHNKLSDKEQEEVNKAIDGILNKMLFEAVKENNIGKVRELIEGKYADVNAKDDKGKTPLHIAIQTRCDEIAKILVDAGADVNERDNEGESPLHVAINNCHDKAAKLLVDLGADVNAKNKYGTTPLYVASKHHHLKVVQALLEKDADVNAKNKYGTTPLYVASKHHHLKVVRALLEKNADVNTTDKYGDTPLHTAAYFNNPGIVTFLLEHSADVNAKNGEGKTPLNIAKEKGFAEIVDILRNQPGSNLSTTNVVKQQRENSINNS